jgi:hypothetical protein
LGAEKQPPAHRATDDQPEESFPEESEVDPGGSGVGAEFALGAAATPATATAGVSYDPPAAETDYASTHQETEYPDTGASGWTYEDNSPSTARSGGLIDDSGVQPASTSPSTSDDFPLTAAASEGPTDVSPLEPAVEAGVEQPPIEDEPEEQPFERDGRWWFKRGDELLIYDEQTGQWQPAPSPSVQALATNPTSAQAGAITAEFAGLRDDAPRRTTTPAATSPVETTAEPTVEAAASDDSEEEAAVTSPDEPVQPTREWESGSFWKCPSCGAVNGSTATSCRMCFAARA